MVVEPNFEDEERKRLLSQYAEIATLAGGLAHEIKNPLSTISMNLELLNEDLAGSDSPRDHRARTRVQTIQRECRHLDEILKAFLEFARVGELKLVESDLNQQVREFIDFYQLEAQKTGIDVSPHLETNLPPVRLDRSLMRQVLMNLARNAQQAMPDGGLLELQTHFRDGHVVLNFIDNGEGIFTDDTTGDPVRALDLGVGVPTDPQVSTGPSDRIIVSSDDVDNFEDERNIPDSGVFYWRELSE